VTSQAEIGKFHEPPAALTLLPPILLALAEQRSLDAVLSTIIKAVNTQPEVALARVWLRERDPSCPVCEGHGAGDGEALHLRASAGDPIDRTADWSRLTGGFHRVEMASPYVVAKASGFIGWDEAGGDVKVEVSADGTKWAAGDLQKGRQQLAAGVRHSRQAACGIF